MKKILFIVGLGLLAVFLAIFVFRREATAPTANEQKSNPEPVPSSQIPPFDKKKYALNDPTSLWIIVNKSLPINPSSYMPDNLVTSSIGGQLRPEAAKALDVMVSDAKEMGVRLRVISSFRSYQAQKSVYEGYVAKDGQTAADTYSARPGTSEHQTGWAVDLGGNSCDLEICFANTTEGKWLAEHAHVYGFIIRYPEGKQSITGYQYEPWHIRYVGTDLALQLYLSKQTMEEFFGVQ